MVRLGKFILIISLLCLFCLFFATKINLACADLGRHIKNGEVFITQHNPIRTNFYSYTEPQYSTITHHWGSGVIFYVIHRYFGFNGLSILYVLVNLIGFLFFFKAAERISNFTYALFFSVLSIPLVSSRLEIRPECFSYLLLGVYFYLLCLFKQKKISFLSVFITLIVLQAAWVNLHIFFFMGPFLVFVFLCESWFNKNDNSVIKQYYFLLAFTTLVCIVNPFGIRGALAPLTIFKEYGYMIAENQSVIFMQKRFHNPVYLYFEFMFAVMIISFAVVFSRRKIKHFIAPILLGIFFSAFSWRAIRGIPIFGLFLIPIASSSFYFLTQDRSVRLQKIVRYALIVLFIILIGVMVFLRFNYVFVGGVPGIGLLAGTHLSADFFKQNKIEGPIFNNYDIGGYLIYYLFPQERVFVDNRPEAYSVSFFKDVYVPMQEDESIWKKIDSQYNFNVIYFYRHDFTPWAQPFLIKRIQDPLWAPVFVDDFTLILLKRNTKNKQLIKLYELPKNIFQITKP